jgi:hypothetical protein
MNKDLSRMSAHPADTLPVFSLRRTNPKVMTLAQSQEAGRDGGEARGEDDWGKQ